jgi:hypothetical protein
MPRRNSTWVATIKSYLRNKSSKSPSRKRRLKQIYVEHVPAPQTEKALDKFLLSVWGNDVASPSYEVDPLTALEIEELKCFYEKKMSELKRNYKVHLSELAHLADTSCTAHKDKELIRAVDRAKSQIKLFDRLRFSLKEQVAATILDIIPESLLLCKRIPPKAASIMNRWYQQHTRHPYPSAKQKQDLAKKCAITIEQVSTWFTRQRALCRPCKRSKRCVRRRARCRRKICSRKRSRAKPKGKGRKIIVKHVRRVVF